MSTERLSPPSKFEIQKDILETDIQVFEDYTIFARSSFQLTHEGVTEPAAGNIIFFSDPLFHKSDYSYVSPFGQEYDPKNPEKLLDIFIYLNNIPEDLAKKINLTIHCNGKEFIGVPYATNDDKTHKSIVSFSSWEIHVDSGVFPIDSVFIPNDKELLNSVSLDIAFKQDN